MNDTSSSPVCSTCHQSDVAALLMAEDDDKINSADVAWLVQLTDSINTVLFPCWIAEITGELSCAFADGSKIKESTSKSKQYRVTIAY